MDAFKLFAHNYTELAKAVMESHGSPTVIDDHIELLRTLSQNGIILSATLTPKELPPVPEMPSKFEMPKVRDQRLVGDPACAPKKYPRPDDGDRDTGITY